MESNEREAKLKASSRQRAIHGQMDDAYQPIRVHALLTLFYNNIWKRDSCSYLRSQTVEKENLNLSSLN